MVSRSEKRWIVQVTFVLLLITSLPYVLGYMSQGKDWRFSGFVFGIEDGNSYLSKMLKGASGDWLYRTPYTAYPQHGLIAFVPYLLLGKLTAQPAQHEQLVALFQLFRWLAGFLLSFATYYLIAYFVKNELVRKLIGILALVGGGLGWLVIVGLGGLFHKGLPLEFYSPETFGFLSLYGLPHLAMARGLMLVGMLWYLKGGESIGKSVFWRYWGGVAWLGLGFFQPLSIISGSVVIAAHLSLVFVFNRWLPENQRQIARNQWNNFFKRALSLAVFSLPWVIYNTIGFLNDPILTQWQLQNIIKSPPMLDYLLAFGVCLIPAGTFIWRNIKKLTPAQLFLIAWLIVFPLLAYFPNNLQRRLPDGIWIGLAILVGLWMEQVHIKRAWLIGFVSFSCISSLLFFSASLAAVLKPANPIFLPFVEVTAYLNLEQIINPGEVVLASYGTGNPLPAWAPANVLIGHGPESAFLKELQPRVNSIFQKTTTDAKRIALINEFNIHYIFWGPQERLLGDWNPSQAAYLKPVYQSDGYSIFRVGKFELPQ